MYCHVYGDLTVHCTHCCESQGDTVVYSCIRVHGSGALDVLSLSEVEKLTIFISCKSDHPRLSYHCVKCSM